MKKGTAINLLPFEKAHKLCPQEHRSVYVYQKIVALTKNDWNRLSKKKKGKILYIDPSDKQVARVDFGAGDCWYVPIVCMKKEAT